MRLRSGYLSALTLTIAVTVVTQPVLAQVYESFRLTFPAYNTGTGLSGAWELGGFNAFSAGYTASERSLSFPGLQTSGGLISGAAFPSINGATRNLTQQLGTDNTTAYLSVLLRPLGTLNAGVFNGFFGITLAGGPANELFVGKPGGCLGARICDRGRTADDHRRFLRELVERTAASGPPADCAGGAPSRNASARQPRGGRRCGGP